jgi:hypothetical protein
MTAVFKRSDVETYLQEGLLAINPIYSAEARAEVLTLEGHYHEPRSVTWLLEKIASNYFLDLVSLRRHCGFLLKIKHHISLPLNDNLVLLPAKVRQIILPGETTVGFVCMQQINRIEKLDSAVHAPWLSRVIFRNGQQLKTLNTESTLNQRLQHGELVRQDFLRHRERRVLFSGLKREALVAQLPACECVLLDLFIKAFDLPPIK